LGGGKVYASLSVPYTHMCVGDRHNQFVRLTLQNARIPGERGLLGSGINVVIENGVITEIEFVGQTSAFALPSGEAEYGDVIDLEGRFLMPGLWDAHVHFGQWAQTRRRLDLARAESADHASQIVGEHLMLRAANRDGDIAQPVVGFGWRGTLWDDVPHKDLLDRYTGRTPVYLFSIDLHSVWLNSAALAERGLEHPTGLLKEHDCYEIEKSVCEVDANLLDDWVHEAAQQASRLGVVGIVDFEMAWNAGDWRRRIQAGNTQLRVEFGIYPDELDRAIEAGMRTGDVIASTDGLLTVGRLKLISDGSLGSRTALCSHPYPGLSGPHAQGVLNYSPRELVALLTKAQTNGLEASVHAIGDKAVTLALDAFDETESAGTIEHAQCVSFDDVERMGGLDLVASIQPEHAMDDRDLVDTMWATQRERVFPIRHMLEAGVSLQFGSDAPVAPLNPWHAIAAAVYRTRDDREPWIAEQSIDIESALEASTRSRLAVGQPADIIALDIDPLTCTRDELRAMTTSLTLVAGRVTHSSLNT